MLDMTCLRPSYALLLAVISVLPACMSDHGARNFVKASKGELDITATAIAIGGASRFAGAVHRCGLNEMLLEGGPYTVFVPTDEAFLTAMSQDPKLLSDNENLKQVMLRHIVKGEVKAAQIVHDASLSPMAGSDLKIENREGRVFIGGGAVLRGDINAKNGVLHFVGSMLIDSSEAKTKESTSGTEK